ncbi:hypothetical protein D3C75_694050 [compost metagenome]
MERKAACPRSHLQDDDRLLRVPLSGPVLQKSEDHLRIGSSDHRVAGDILRHLIIRPGLHAELLIITALQLPERRLAEAVALLLFICCHLCLNLLSNNLGSIFTSYTNGK